MFITYLHIKLEDNLYQIKSDLSNRDELIKKYDLKFIDNFKKYCIQDIEIIPWK